MSPEIAGTMNEMLSGVISRGTGKSAAIPRPVAGKNRDDPGVPRRLVYRLHADLVAGVARQRRQFAD